MLNNNFLSPHKEDWKKQQIILNATNILLAIKRKELKKRHIGMHVDSEIRKV